MKKALFFFGALFFGSASWATFSNYNSILIGDLVAGITQAARGFLDKESTSSMKMLKKLKIYSRCFLGPPFTFKDLIWGYSTPPAKIL